jgi:hypothetical protein
MADDETSPRVEKEGFRAETLERPDTWPSECIFCGRPEITEEHAFAKKWIRKLLPQGGVMIAGQNDLRRDPAERTYRSHYIDVVSPCVCAKCNNEWMNVLDQRAQPLMAPMVASLDRLALSLEDQRVLATWAVKVALVLDYAETLDRPEADPRPLGIVKPPVHHYLYQQGIPPDYVHVWLAAQEDVGLEILSLAGGRQGPPPTLSGAPLLGEEAHQMYVATFRVGHAIFQVFVPDPGSTWVPERDPQFADSVIQLWPPTFKPAWWPPAAVVERDDRMHDLHLSLGGHPTIL